MAVTRGEDGDGRRGMHAAGRDGASLCDLGRDCCVGGAAGEASAVDLDDDGQLHPLWDIRRRVQEVPASDQRVRCQSAGCGPLASDTRPSATHELSIVALPPGASGALA